MSIRTSEYGFTAEVAAGETDQHSDNLGEHDNSGIASLEERLSALQTKRSRELGRETYGSGALAKDMQAELRDLEAQILEVEVQIAAIKNPEFAEAAVALRRNAEWGNRLAKAKGWLDKVNRYVNVAHPDLWEPRSR